MSEPPEDGTQASPSRTSRHTFTIACWLMALIAFAQLISIGTALAVRHSQPENKTALPLPGLPAPVGLIEPRSLKEILASYDSGAETAIQHTGEPPLVSTVIPNVTPSIAAETSKYPVIADPQVERLVEESRKLRMSGDMMRSMLKLDEAERIDPSESAVIYQKALLFEDMGIFSKAADHYQKIQQRGIQAGI